MSMSPHIISDRCSDLPTAIRTLTRGIPEDDFEVTTLKGLSVVEPIFAAKGVRGYDEILDSGNGRFTSSKRTEVVFDAY